MISVDDGENTAVAADQEDRRFSGGILVGEYRERTFGRVPIFVCFGETQHFGDEYYSSEGGYNCFRRYGILHVPQKFSHLFWRREGGRRVPEIERIGSDVFNGGGGGGLGVVEVEGEGGLNVPGPSERKKAGVPRAPRSSQPNIGIYSNYPEIRNANASTHAQIKCPARSSYRESESPPNFSHLNRIPLLIKISKMNPTISK
jgi:hypothetical protein